MVTENRVRQAGGENADDPFGERSDERIPVTNESDIVLVRGECRRLAEELGMGRTAHTAVATAVSEIARNILLYAGAGLIRVRHLKDGGREGIEVVAEDEGPGIQDIDQAMQDGWSTSRGLGIGLPGSKRLMDEFEIESTPGKGTKIRMLKWCRTTTPDMETP